MNLEPPTEVQLHVHLTQFTEVFAIYFEVSLHISIEKIGKCQPHFHASVVPKPFQLEAPLPYWATGHGSPLRLQSYTLYRRQGFQEDASVHLAGFHVSQEATALSLGSTTIHESLQTQCFAAQSYPALE